jgi:hypothetical protein
MICHDNKFIFVRVAKTASSSIVSSLFPNYKRLKKINTKVIKWTDQDENHYPLSKVKEVARPEIYNSYFKFGFVRNPWDRVVSSYHYMLRFGSIQEMSIKNFLEYISNTPVEHKYLSQYNYINGCDFVGKFENLQKDFDIICDKIRIPKRIVGHLKKTKNRKHYTEYYDNETTDLVAKKYAKDIEHFNYRFGE